MGMSVPHSVALSLAMCFALPALSLSGVKDVGFNRLVRVDASAHIQVRTVGPLAASASIKGPVPKDKDGARWEASSGPGKGLAMAAFTKASQCSRAGKAECVSWTNDLNCDQTLTIAAAIQASKTAKANFIKLLSVTNKCPGRSSSWLKHVSFLKKVGTSQFKSEGTSTCIDPAVDDAEEWACDCLDAAVDTCGGVDEACFVNLLCGNAEICRSWKDVNCGASSLIASPMQQHIKVRSESVQIKSPAESISSGASILEHNKSIGTSMVTQLVAGAMMSRRAQQTSAEGGTVDDVVSGKCTAETQ